jgi:hypothetical protein
VCVCVGARTRGTVCKDSAEQDHLQ